jgi:ACT domain-containing protein
MKVKAIVTVTGRDKTGIIAGVSAALAECGINILDISQTVLQDYFAMIMLVDLSSSEVSFKDLSEKLTETGRNMCMDIRIMREEIFDAMHRI